MAAYSPKFLTAYNNGGATLNMSDARKPLQIKAFRASLTLAPAGYIAAADTVMGRHLPLCLGQMAVQAVAPPQDICLPRSQLTGQQLMQQTSVLLALQLLQHGVLFSHHIAQIQCVTLRSRVQRLIQRHFALQFFLSPEVH